MNKTSKLITVFIIFLAICGNIQAQNKGFESRIDSVLKLMTLEEKVGQMNQYNGFWEVTGPAPKDGNAKMKYEHLKKGLVGSMLNVKGTAEVRKLQELVMKETRLKIPLIFGFDVIHGYKTISPIPLAESASWDLEAIEKSARIAAIEAAAVGINWTFAPMVDISRDARWGRVMEGAGEDTYLGSKIGIARVKGFQGNDLSSNNTIAACAKHFAAYGFIEAGRDYNTVDIGTYTLHNVVFPPFKAIIESGVRTVMNSFNVLNGVPATANKFLQREILKDKWKFDGFIISDWSSGAEMINHGFAANLKEVAETSANGGSDMDMESLAYVSHLKEAVENGKVDIKLVDDAVKRILRVKFELGLFDDPYKYCDEKREKELIRHPDHIAGVLDMAKKSIVLLKNDKQLLPLKKTQDKIAIIGALAEDKDHPLGSWVIGADKGTAVSVLEGFKKYNNNFKFAKGANSTFEQDEKGFAEAVALAKKSEIVVMVLGEGADQSGEARSRTTLDLPGSQQKLLEAVYAVNKNIVLVLMNGRPLAITWADKNIPCILESWHLGTESGNAIAQVLFGDYNPSGKLTMTFPRNVGQVPIYYNYFNTGRGDYQPHRYWSHYIDESNAPLYPFGYGLSYTQFEYSNLQIDASNQNAVKVQVTVKNIGKLAGEEVTQLYIRDKFASFVRPVKELKGFKKFALAPNESKVIDFVLTEAELGFYTDKGDFIVEAGEFEVMVGTDSQKLLKGGFVRK